MFTLLYAGALVVMVVLGIIIIASITKRQLASTAVDDLKRELADEQVILGALADFQGRASFGKKQVVGQGALILTARQLVFKMAVPQRKLAISLHSISDADLAKDLGPGVKALAVYFHDDKADVEDVAIWLVEDVDNWALQIRAARLRATMGTDLSPPDELPEPGRTPGPASSHE